MNYTFGICNYAGGWVSNGVYLSVTGNIAGGLAQRLDPISPSQIPNLLYTITLTLPIFTPNPTAFNLFVQVKDNIQVKPGLIFTQLTFIVSGGNNANAYLQTDFTANLNGNPGPIYFKLEGTVYETGAFTLKGQETGVWNNVFGIQGFELSAVVAELGFSPSVCMLTGKKFFYFFFFEL